MNLGTGRAATLLRFALVGAAVAGSYVLLYLAFQAAGLDRAAANALAFALAVVLQYLGQARLTYRRRLADGGQIGRFALMIGCGFATSALVTGILGPRLGLSDALSAAAVALLLPVQNFLLMTLWVFSRQNLPGAQAR
ncbi:GtrA family protein [Oceaniglobus roseus]|uniref:GtrA family protein n=1 Tax=Oceaniglobus roseus TaxID=1737570 RepID=UPI000C7F1A8F|nr:GtrA family protein [Kandeliimicrobium roseum]